MDVNLSSDVKMTGISMPTTVEKEDMEKSQVASVEESTDSSQIELGDKELHARLERAQELASLSLENMEEISEEIQERLDKMGTGLGFAVHQNKDGETIIARVTNKKSGELVKQIPAEEILMLQEKLQEVAGILFDEKV